MQDPAHSDIDGNWDDVRVFLAAVRHKSLGAAAAKLGVDISTVSRRLTAFEERLGARLFERTRSGLVATPSADAVIAAAEAMETAHDRFGRDAHASADVAGTVRLTCAPGMADAFVAPMLAKLRERHPQIDIELDASTQPRDVARHEAEIALRSVRPRGAELVITKVGDGDWVVAGAPSLLLKKPRLTSWSALPWITWDKDLAQFEPCRWVARHVDKQQIALRTSHFASQLTAAETGLGLVLAPRPYLRVRALKVVAPRALSSSTATLPTAGLWLVGHRAHRTVPRIAAVWRFLADELRASMA